MPAVPPLLPAGMASADDGTRRGVPTDGSDGSAGRRTLGLRMLGLSLGALCLGALCLRALRLLLGRCRLWI